MDPTSGLAAASGTLQLGARCFVIPPPTPRDMLAVSEHMKQLAKAKCVSPLEYVLGHASLTPAALSLAVAEAIKLGSGGGIEPTPDAVWAEFVTLAGVRWRAWYHASRALPDLAPEDIAALVTPDNAMDVAEKLDAALRLRALDPNDPGPATGTPS